jgi:DNA-binding NarL/FixJ family response regulator
VNEETIRILIADDHALVREGIRHVLEEDPGFDVVGEAADGAEAMAMTIELRPQVLILDITMPELSGLEVAARLRREESDVRVLILSMHDDAEYVARAVKAGAHGYLLKDDAGPAQLREAVRAIQRGEPFFSPGVASRLTDILRGGAETARQVASDLLTGRELDVLRGVAAGRSNKEIAAALGIGRRTVESHRESLMRKLKIRTVAGLTRLALEEGLLDDSPSR